MSNGFIEVTGFDDLMRRLSAVGPKAVEQATGALYREGEAIMAVAKDRTPRETGALINSGHVQLPSRPANGDVQVALAFGGPAAPYALIVHEDLEAVHPVGQAKYLESAVLEAIPGMAQRIADEIDW